MIDLTTKEEGIRVINAIARQEGDPDFETIKGWLNAILKNLNIDWIALSGEALTRSQGAAELLRDIMAIMNDPHSEIARINSKEIRRQTGARISEHIK